MEANAIIFFMHEGLVTTRQGTAAALLMLILFLSLSFVRLQSDPAGLSRVSAESREKLLTAPAPWFPRILADSVPERAVVSRTVDICIVLLAAALFCVFLGRVREGLIVFSVPLFIRFYLYGVHYLEAEVFYHVFFLFAFVFLCSRNKLGNLRFTVAAAYFFAGILKLNPSWLSGRVFTSVPGGELPFLPDWAPLVQAACIALVLLELAGPFLLFARPPRLRLATWSVFVAFHVYSLFLLDYRFPTLMLGVLVALYPHVRDQQARPTRSDWPVFSLLVAVFLISQYHLLIQGAKLITQEGKTAGLFMYDANAVCKAEIEFEREGAVLSVTHVLGYRKGARYADGAVVSEPAAEFQANVSAGAAPAAILPDGGLKWMGSPVYHRALLCGGTRRICCDPYVFREYLNELRSKQKFDRVGLRLSLDLNGHRRWFSIVDEKDFVPANLPYSFIKHNPWIQIPDKNFPAEYLWP